MSEHPEQVGTIPEWTLGDRLDKSLRDSGMSIGEMADHLAVSRNTVGNYIAGRSMPNMATINVWAIRTGVNVDWLRGSDFRPRARATISPLANQPRKRRNPGVPSAYPLGDVAVNDSGQGVTPRYPSSNGAYLPVAAGF